MGHGEVITDLEFSKDGKFLFSSSFDRTIRKWNVEEGKEMFIFKGHSDRVMGLSLGPLEKEMTSFDLAGGLLTWDSEKGKTLDRRVISPAISPGFPAYDVVRSPDGKSLLIANGSGSVLLSRYPEGP